MNSAPPASSPAAGPKPGPAILEKCPTGIQGFDEITFGGLPKGRPSLICGSAGCGKTLFSLEFLVNGIMHYGEPGVFIAFEETPEDLAKNVASLGFDLQDLERRNLLVVDYIRVERAEIAEAGAFDLEGLFIRLLLAVESVGAKRIAIDTLETLFAGFTNEAVLRAEIKRLFYWIKEKNLTAIITAERGEGVLTRQGLEEYVSDCVILLDHRVVDQNSTRRLRIVKYRGSRHGTNEYPFLIDDHGISVLPLSSLGLQHKIQDARVSTGISGLDEMLEGKGYYAGSTVLLSGTAGVGKTSIAAHFAHAACSRGDKVLYFAFEESFDQVARNMGSIGIDLKPCSDKGLLRFQASRPSLHGLEMHLVRMHRAVQEMKPKVVIIDPITNLLSAGTANEINSMLVRLIDFLKVEGITALLTSLTSGSNSGLALGTGLEATEVGISSLVDTWILLRDMEVSGERNRGLYVLKSRGMAHSNQIREFNMTSRGVELRPAYIGPEGVLTGSARLSQEAREKAETLRLQQGVEALERESDRKKKALEAQILALHAQFEAEEEERRQLIRERMSAREEKAGDRLRMAKSRRSGD